MKFGVFSSVVLGLVLVSAAFAAGPAAKPQFTRFLEEIAARSGQDVIAVRDAAVQSLVASKKYSDADLVRIRDGKESEINGIRQTKMVHTITRHIVFLQKVKTWTEANRAAFAKASEAFVGIEIGGMVDRIYRSESEANQLAALRDLKNLPYNAKYEEIYQINDKLSYHLTAGKASSEFMVEIINTLGTRGYYVALADRIQLELVRVSLMDERFEIRDLASKVVRVIKITDELALRVVDLFKQAEQGKDVRGAIETIAIEVDETLANSF